MGNQTFFPRNFYLIIFLPSNFFFLLMHKYEDKYGTTKIAFDDLVQKILIEHILHLII